MMLRPAVIVVRQLAASRLVQFLVLGGALLVATPRRADDRTINLSGQRLEALAQREAERRGQATADAGLRAQVLAQVVQDEILVREARRLGLDQDDVILRRRLIQKALFLAEDLGGASRQLSEHELAGYFANHRDDYQQPARYGFRHVFAAEAATLVALAPAVRTWAALHPEEVPPFGEPLPVERRVDATAARITQDFGAELVASLATAPVARWIGPVPSRLGYHLIFVDRATPAHRASYAEVAEQVRLDAVIARRQTAVAGFFAQAQRRYHLAIDGQATPPPIGGPRSAAHFAASVED